VTASANTSHYSISITKLSTKGCCCFSVATVVISVLALTILIAIRAFEQVFHSSSVDIDGIALNSDIANAAYPFLTFIVSIIFLFTWY